MKTIKEITERLDSIKEPESWLKQLEDDERVGVKKELARWYRNYEKQQKMNLLLQSKIDYDDSYRPFRNALLAGVDEAGRGPLAGPVVCAAVVLPNDVSQLLGLDDSKKLSKSERLRLAIVIKEISISYSIHVQSAAQIDAMNIYAATRQSMEIAVNTLQCMPDIILADAMSLNVGCQSVSIIKGDEKSLAVAAASVLAKTTRDSLLEELDLEFPMYNFKKNAGYGTAEHLEALYAHGPCKHHRKTFEPVKSILGGEQK